MLPNLEYFRCENPIYIRKIDKPRHWNPEGCNSLQERAQQAAMDIFEDGINSLYLVNSNQDIYAMVVAISARRNPKYQNIDFIWITEKELQEVEINIGRVVEGDCLYAQNLHFHADINHIKSIQLCENLMLKNRKDQRFHKQDTRIILETLENLGCQAIISNSQKCQCQEPHPKDGDLQKS